MRARLRRRPLLVGLFVLVVVSGGASAGYAALGTSRVSAAAVGVEIAGQLAADAGALHPGVVRVYQARQNLPVWHAPDAYGAALRVLGHADRDGLPMDQRMERLGAWADTASTAASLASLDLALTDALLRYGDALGRPRVDASELYGVNWTPAPPTPGDPAAEMVAALAAAEATTEQALAVWADALRPQHPGYRRLRAALARELDLAAVPAIDRDLAPGDSGAAVATLHARLAVAGEAVEGRTFTEATAQAVRAVQRRRQLAETGRLDAATREALNRRQPEVIPLLQLNLEKWRWLPNDLGDLHIWVNVPRFELALRERAADGWDEAIRFRSVVGASDWQTPSFTDTLETVVFNPTWIVPASIQRESYGRVRGRVVRPPGPGNAMGRVKFLFPNRHAVYVHDTPTKWAFGVDDRARSHGCVRAGDPEGLAREILTRTNGWSAERVAAIFRGPWRGPDPHRVEATVPVHLVYFTAEVDADGTLQVWDDVYGRDQRLAEALGLDLPEMSSDVIASLIADRIGNEQQVLDAQRRQEQEETVSETAGSESEPASEPAAPTAPPTAAPAPTPAASAAPARAPGRSAVTPGTVLTGPDGEPVDLDAAQPPGRDARALSDDG